MFLFLQACVFFETDIVINDKRRKFVSERNRLRESKKKHVIELARGARGYTSFNIIDYHIILLSRTSYV